MERNAFVAHDTEDKGWWCLHGEREELHFVNLCRIKLNLDAAINPDKRTNRYAPDLVVKGVVSDLKVQNTPFFSSSKYGRNPARTVTFNKKDFERYSAKYPGIDIYFWVEWLQTSWNGMTVPYLAGIYRQSFAEVARAIKDGAPEHCYKHRMDDTRGNAKSSFLLNLDDFECLFETNEPRENSMGTKN